jgi:hypothetical protein
MAMVTKGGLEKLRLKDGETVFLRGVPPEVFESIAIRLEVQVNDPSTASVLFIFVRDFTEMEATVPPLADDLGEGARLWIAYSKRTSGMVSDIDRDRIIAWAPEKGLRAVANFAIDGTWSAVRLGRE